VKLIPRDRKELVRRRSDFFRRRHGIAPEQSVNLISLT
jgi:hypothetical protein